MAAFKERSVADKEFLISLMAEEFNKRPSSYGRPPNINWSPICEQFNKSKRGAAVVSILSVWGRQENKSTRKRGATPLDVSTSPKTVALHEVEGVGDLAVFCLSTYFKDDPLPNEANPAVRITCSLSSGIES